jgi:hypothetical protein
MLHLFIPSTALGDSFNQGNKKQFRRLRIMSDSMLAAVRPVDEGFPPDARR